jgi:hypothetical protein
VLNTQPFAIALATSSEENLESKIEIFDELGLTYPKSFEEENGVWPIIATNKLFDDIFRDPTL